MRCLSCVLGVRVCVRVCVCQMCTDVWLLDVRVVLCVVAGPGWDVCRYELMCVVLHKSKRARAQRQTPARGRVASDTEI
jgi:hypothetical protein